MQFFNVKSLLTRTCANIFYVLEFLYIIYVGVVRYTPDINQVLIVNFPRSNNWPLSKVQFAEFGERSFRENAARPKRDDEFFSPFSSVIASMSKEMLR